MPIAPLTSQQKIHVFRKFLKYLEEQGIEFYTKATFPLNPMDLLLYLISVEKIKGMLDIYSGKVKMEDLHKMAEEIDKDINKQN